MDETSIKSCVKFNFFFIKKGPYSKSKILNYSFWNEPGGVEKKKKWNAIGFFLEKIPSMCKYLL